MRPPLQTGALKNNTKPSQVEVITYMSLKIPNNEKTRSLHKQKLWGSFVEAFYMLKNAAESYQHPVLPINCYAFSGVSKQLKTTSEDLEKRGADTDIIDRLINSSEYKDLMICVDDQLQLQADVYTAFQGLLGHVTPADYVDRLMKRDWDGPVLQSLKDAYVDAKLAIEHGLGEKAHVKFFEGFEKLKDKHVAPFEARMNGLKNHYNK